MSIKMALFCGVATIALGLSLPAISHAEWLQRIPRHLGIWYSDGYHKRRLPTYRAPTDAQPWRGSQLYHFDRPTVFWGPEAVTYAAPEQWESVLHTAPAPSSTQSPRSENRPVLAPVPQARYQDHHRVFEPIRYQSDPRHGQRFHPAASGPQPQIYSPNARLATPYPHSLR